MKPFPYSADLPTSIASFGIDWPKLVVESTRMPETALPYVGAIAKYSNCDVADGATFAVALKLAADPELDRLLGLVHQLHPVQPAFAAQLLSCAKLEMEGMTVERTQEAKFEWLSPFALEGTLAEDLYRYGMYDHFYEHHTPNDARELARDLMQRTTGDVLEDIVPLTTRLPWSDWFDPHSCTDRSWILLEKKTRRAWIFAFSHSD